MMDCIGTRACPSSASLSAARRASPTCGVKPGNDKRRVQTPAPLISLLRKRARERTIVDNVSPHLVRLIGPECRRIAEEHPRSIRRYHRLPDRDVGAAAGREEAGA